MKTRTLIYALSPSTSRAAKSTSGEYLDGWYPPLKGRRLPDPAGFHLSRSGEFNEDLRITLTLSEPYIDPVELSEDPNAEPSYSNALNLYLHEVGTPYHPKIELTGAFATSVVIDRVTIFEADYEIIAEYVQD